MHDNEKQILISPVKSRRMEREHREKMAQNKGLREKVDSLRSAADILRLEYNRELNYYKEQEKTRRARLIHQAHLAVEDEEERVAIPVEFFDSLAGLDPPILQLVNEKIAFIQHIYQERARTNLRYQEVLVRKINYYNKLSPNAYGIINLSLQEIFDSLAQIETDANKIWN